MLRNDQIQAGLIAKLKADATILAELKDINGESVADEIREDQYQGDAYFYPQIRVRLISSSPLSDVDCEHTRFSVSFQVFSEQSSSLQADRIAGIINAQLHGKQFIANSIAFSLRLNSLVAAVRQDMRTWRSEVVMTGIASM